MIHTLNKAFLSCTILFLGFSLFLSAEVATISGTLYQEEAVVLRYDPHYLGEKITELSSEGISDKFQFELEMEQANLVELVCLGRKFSLFLEPGDDLEINFEQGPDKPVLAFAGSAAKNNEVWSAYTTTFADKIADKVYETKLAADVVDAWEFWLYDQRKLAWDAYKEHPSKGMISSAFKELLEAEIKYSYQAGVLAYPIEKAKTNSAKNFTPLPYVMMESINEKMVNRENGMSSPAYRQFIEYFVYYLSAELNRFAKFESATASLEAKYTASSGIVPEEAMNYVLTKYIYENCEKIESPIARKYVMQMTRSVNPVYGEILTEECGEWLDAPDPKQEAALAEKTSRDKKRKSQPFTLTDYDGTKVFLGDLQGKVVYVDFWASWCGPCRMQFPFAKKMKDQLSKKQKEEVVFLYISIDNNEEAWKKGMERAGVDGLHAFSPGGWGASVCNYFNIKSIPRYLLIDKKGEIVNSNAPRPQDPAALAEILELLGSKSKKNKKKK